MGAGVVGEVCLKTTCLRECVDQRSHEPSQICLVAGGGRQFSSFSIDGLCPDYTQTAPGLHPDCSLNASLKILSFSCSRNPDDGNLWQTSVLQANRQLAPAQRIPFYVDEYNIRPFLGLDPIYCAPDSLRGTWETSALFLFHSLSTLENITGSAQ